MRPVKGNTLAKAFACLLLDDTFVMGVNCSYEANGCTLALLQWSQRSC